MNDAVHVDVFVKMILMFTSQGRAPNTGFCQVEQNYPSRSQNKNVVQTNTVCIMELSSF